LIQAKKNLNRKLASTVLISQKVMPASSSLSRA